MPSTFVHARKYRTEDKLKTDITKTKHNPEKATNAKYSKTKVAWFSRLIVASYNTQPDLSVSFDTVYYNIPITRLLSWFGIHGFVLNWFNKSCLTVAGVGIRAK